MDQNTKVLEKRDVRVEQVVSPQLANAMNQLLKGVWIAALRPARAAWDLPARRPAKPDHQ